MLSGASHCCRMQEVGTTLLKTCIGSEHNPVCTIVPEGPGAEDSLNFRIDKLVSAAPAPTSQRNVSKGGVSLCSAGHAGRQESEERSYLSLRACTDRAIPAIRRETGIALLVASSNTSAAAARLLAVS